MSSSGLRGQLAVLSLNVEPLGAVMGAAIYQLYRPTGCWGFVPTRGPNVYVDYQQGLTEAWQAGISRLRAEAADIGAHGVLGVNVSQSWMDTGAGSTFQLQLTGSAIRFAGQSDLGTPFLANLSMPDFLRLLIGGWIPRDIVWGIALTHVHGWDARPLKVNATISNMEMPAPTRAMHEVRSELDEQARLRLEAMCGTGGVNMSVTMERSSQDCPGLSKGGQMARGPGVMIDGRILGTGIVRFRAPVMRPTPRIHVG